MKCGQKSKILQYFELLDFLGCYLDRFHISRSVSVNLRISFFHFVELFILSVIGRRKMRRKSGWRNWGGGGMRWRWLMHGEACRRRSERRWWRWGGSKRRLEDVGALCRVQMCNVHRHPSPFVKLDVMTGFILFPYFLNSLNAKRNSFLFLLHPLALNFLWLDRAHSWAPNQISCCRDCYSALKML